MKFYNSVGPNPRIVRMFMAEKGMRSRADLDLARARTGRPSI